MIEKFMRYLVERGADGAVKIEHPARMNGHPYAVGHGKAKPLDWPEPEPFIFPDRVLLGTLSGLVLALKANIDEWDMEKLMIVCTSNVVEVKDVLQGAEKMRPGLVRAVYQVPEEKIRAARVQAFRLSVVQSFEETPERKRLLEVSEAFKSESHDTRSEEATGMGISYTASQNRLAGGRTDISAEEMVFELSPYRSFPEAGDQVAVPFLLSIDAQPEEIPTGTLTDCGGEAWRAVAAEQVGKKVQELCEEQIASPVVW